MQRSKTRLPHVSRVACSPLLDVNWCQHGFPRQERLLPTWRFKLFALKALGMDPQTKQQSGSPGPLAYCGGCDSHVETLGTVRNTKANTTQGLNSKALSRRPTHSHRDSSTVERLTSWSEREPAQIPYSNKPCPSHAGLQAGWCQPWTSMDIGLAHNILAHPVPRHSRTPRSSPLSQWTAWRSTLAQRGGAFRCFPLRQRKLAR